MPDSAIENETATHMDIWLLRAGALLFLLGLLTGLVLPAMANPRMGLSSHLEGVMNGIVLLVMGLLLNRLTLSAPSKKVLVATAIYGTFANWLATLLAGFWGAGSAMMPIAAEGFRGSSAQEAIITFGLVSLSVAMMLVIVMVLWGLRRPA